MDSTAAADGHSRRIVIDATPENAKAAITFMLDATAAIPTRPEGLAPRMAVCVDEIFTNIARYAYPTGTGTVEIGVSIRQDPVQVTLTFKDAGIPFNPLERADPDTTLGAEERDLGGLGILMIKELTDEVHYRRDGEYNVLTIVKSF